MTDVRQYADHEVPFEGAVFAPTDAPAATLAFGTPDSRAGVVVARRIE